MGNPPKYFPKEPGLPGPPGKEGDKGVAGDRSQWRLYIMGDHPNAIPGETYSDPSVGDGWLAMGDAYLTPAEAEALYLKLTGGTITGDLEVQGEIELIPGVGFKTFEGKLASATTEGSNQGGYSGMYAIGTTQADEEKTFQIGGALSYNVDVDDYAGDAWLTATNNVNISGGAVTIQGVTDPADPNDAANKKYVDDSIAAIPPPGGGGGGGLQIRATASVTTASLAAGASESSTLLLANGYRLYRITTSAPARVRLYTTTGKRDSDASRPIGTDPTGDHGCAFEFVSTASVLGADLSPVVDGFDGKATPDGQIPYSITNTGTAAAAITATFVWIRSE